MSFFAWNMEMSFFGMPLYILDSCPENRDESNGNSIVRLWLQFIPIFGALHSQLRKGHTTKKDIPMFFTCIAYPQKGIKKDISILFSIFSFSGEEERETPDAASHLVLIQSAHIIKAVVVMDQSSKSRSRLRSNSEQSRLSGK